MTDSLRERLWSVVESAIMEGVSALEFKKTLAGHWQEALRDKAKYDAITLTSD